MGTLTIPEWLGVLFLLVVVSIVGLLIRMMRNNKN